MIRNDSISPLTLQSRIEHAWNLHKMVYTQLIRNFLGHIWPNFWKCMTDELGIEWYRLGTRTNTKMRVNLINFRLQVRMKHFQISRESCMNSVCITHGLRMYEAYIPHIYVDISMKQPCKYITDESRTPAHLSRMN